MSLFGKAERILKEGGLGSFLNRGVGFVYRHAVRPHLPNGAPARMNGVLIRERMKRADRYVPALWLPGGMTDHTGCSTYEAALMHGLKGHVAPGDHVVIVGGGLGVTAVGAARRAGSGGKVTCFEGSLLNCAAVRETAALNRVRVGVHHAVVAQPIGVYGERSGIGRVIPPAALPHCDVLELDCEGAEVQILREMTLRPRVLLVETHGLYAAPSPRVRELMEERGYAVTDLGWAEPHDAASCERNDIRVLLGLRA